MSHLALCTYRVKEDRADEFLGHLRRHWPTLHQFELVTPDHHLILRGAEEDGKPFFVELLSWSSPEAPRLAEQLPEVLRVWEPMGKLCESRRGLPPMEFPIVSLVNGVDESG
jgi:hypothetical protein